MHHGQPRRDFFIVSEMNGKVVDIKGAHTAAGTNAIMYHRKNPPERNQLWYVDHTGHIRSSLNDMTFHSAGKGHEIKMQMPVGDPKTQWRFEGPRIINGHGECLDIKGEKKDDGAELCSYDFKNQKNQLWRMEYA